MSHIERFGQFDGAISDLRRAVSLTKEPAFARMSAAAADAISSGQRFYLPAAKDVLEGRLIDVQAKALMRLPYERTVVLSETPVNMPDGSQVNSWKISIAF